MISVAWAVQESPHNSPKMQMILFSHVVEKVRFVKDEVLYTGLSSLGRVYLVDNYVLVVEKLKES